MAMGNADAQALSAGCATMTPSHVGGGPCLIDEDQSLRIKLKLGFEPLFSPLQDVGTVLLGRVHRLFLLVIRRRSKNRRSVPSATWVPRSAKYQATG